MEKNDSTVSGKHKMSPGSNDLSPSLEFISKKETMTPEATKKI